MGLGGGARKAQPLAHSASYLQSSISSCSSFSHCGSRAGSLGLRMDLRVSKLAFWQERKESARLNTEVTWHRAGLRAISFRTQDLARHWA